MGLFDDLPDASPGIGVSPEGIPQITVYARPKIPQEGRALLDTIAGSESTGYDVLYGGGKFKDYADHPRQAIPIQSGPNVGRTTSAAGRYQFLGSTWDEVKKEAGLPDFSPESQDEGAWYLSQRVYKQKTGRDLTQDLQAAKDNPAVIKQIGSALSGTWTSLPGGIEPNRATQSFAERYLQSGQPAGAAVSPANAPLGAQPKSSGLFDDLPLAKPAAIGPEQPDIGRGTAFLTGLEQGITANFGDEIRGARAAAGLPKLASIAANAVPVGGALEPVMGLARLGYEYLTGGDEAAKRYAEAQEQFRSQVKTAERQYPGTTIAGNVVGGIATPGGALLRGATLGKRVLGGATLGATYGGLSGAGEGTTAEDRASRAAVGTALGGVVGAAGVPVIELGAKGIGALVSKPASYIQAGINPRAAAERNLGRTFNEALEADPLARNRITPQDLTPSGPARAMDVLGEPGRDLARDAGNISGKARAQLNPLLAERAQEQGERVIGWLNKSFNYPEVHAQQKAIKQEAATVNRPAYRKAFSEHDGPMWDEGLAGLAQDPVVQSAIRRAASAVRTERTIEGYRPLNNPFTFEESTGRLTLKKDQNGKTIYPDLQFWDLVKRELDKSNTREAQSFAASLRGHLDELTSNAAGESSYKAARQGAAGFFDAESALVAGQNFASRNFSLPEARAELQKMTPEQRKLFQDGFVSEYIDKLSKLKFNRDVVKEIYNSIDSKQRFQMVLGPQRSAELEALVRVEGIMQQGLQAVAGNSTTARQLITHGVAGATAGGSGAYGLGYDPSTVGIISALTAAGKRGIDIRVAKHVAELLASKDPDVFNRGIKMISGSTRLMDALRSADAAAARVGGGQAQAISGPAVQIPVPARAEQQPEVPGPPGR